jgi:hypothetical protein
MKKEKPLNLKNFSKFIEVVISRLENGQSRFSNLYQPEYPLSSACLREFSSPDYSERLMSDYGVPSESNNKDIQKDYYEEINLIETLIEEYKIPVRLAEWQKGKLAEATENINKSLNLRSLAIQIWEWYAIPWRYKSGSVYLIWQSHDILGSPIIKNYPIDYFLKTISDGLENKITYQIKTSKQLEFWKSLGIVFIVVIGFYIFIKLTN